MERASGRAGASGGPAAWPAGSGPASPPARGPPGHRRGRLGGASLAPPAVVEAAGHLMGRPAEFRGVVPAALMCGRPARRQLVPPRRPRATIDTHQAAAAGSTPSPGRLCRSFRGLPSRAGRGRAGGGRGARGASAPLRCPRSPDSSHLPLPLCGLRVSLHPLSPRPSPSPSLPLSVQISGRTGHSPGREAVALHPPRAPTFPFSAPLALGVPGDSGDKARARGTSMG